MSDNLISQYLGEETKNQPQQKPTGYQAYAVAGEKQGREIMLDVGLKTGDAEAFAYSYLMSVRFIRSKGLVLTFTNAKVSITGRNLEQLYAFLLRHRVSWLQVGNQAESMEVAEDSPFIESIEIKAR